jgi:hypothetical protein
MDRPDMEAAMARKDSGVGKDAVGGKRETPIAALRDEDLAAVAGGAIMLMGSAASNVIKTLGEALSTMARKQ